MTWRSNCAIWAVRQWMRHGGWVGIRDSHWGWWVHLTWSPDRITWYEFVPIAPKRPRHWWEVPVVFEGHVVVSRDGE